MKEKIETFKGKTVRHFKGNMYLIEEIAMHSETNEWMVVYRALYGACGCYVRPYEMFFEEVPKEKSNPTGQKYRFEFFTIKSV
ncbi:MAG: DUF1653 domain-containing protein [Treponema sp.]|nr:DUF1653 domain-containing protein [Treponema sp.]